MLQRLKKAVSAGAVMLTTAVVQAAAYAADTAGISERTAQEVGQRVVDIVKDVTMPLGSAVIFIAVVITAFKLIATAGKPEERGKVIGSIPYIIGGGVVLGAAILIAGWIIGMMVKASS